MHIAFVISTLRGGGAERSVLELAGGLIHRGHKVDIVLLRTRVHYPTEIPKEARLFVVDNRPDEQTKQKAAQVLESLIQLDAPSRPLDWLRVATALKWDPLCVPDRRLVRQTRAVARYIELAKPDCVFPSLPQPKAATLLAARLLNECPPIVPTLRNFLGYRGLRHRRRYRHLFVNAQHFVGISRGVSQSLATTVGVPTERITTIYNPVVTPRLHSKMAQPPSHPWLLDGGPPIILSAGRLEEQKDYPTLIKAFAHLTLRRPCRLIIVGEGRLRRHLERFVERLGISEHVSLAGWVENPFALMSRASCFVLSSRHEGLGRVLIEALACGCPCVSTDCPAGPAEILENGKFGGLVPVGDDVALADAMDQALNHPWDRQRLADRAAHFSLERCVDAHEQLIQTLVAPSF